jgi:hypothetical protein
VGAFATSFPLSKHTGEDDTAPVFSGLHVYLQFMWEVGLPPSPVEFSSHCCFYKLSCSKVTGWGPPLLPSPAWLVYLQFCEGFPLPPLQHSGRPTLFAACLFVVVAYYSVFSLFSLGGGSVCPGDYADLAQGCLWEY